MQKIIDVVTELFRYDDDAKNAIDKGIFSINKYARKITPLVSKILLKPVSTKTVAVSVYRLCTQLTKNRAPTPPIILQSLSLHPRLAEITYERTNEILQALSLISTTMPIIYNGFYTQTSSVSEVTIIVEDSVLPEVMAHMIVSPKFQLSHLAGITVRFNASYIGEPRLIYELTKRLSMNDINIVEVVSTASELTYIVDRYNAEKAITLLNKFATN